MKTSRRDNKEMMDIIQNISKDDERISAVIMNGSRASPSAKKDVFQDYDIIYIVSKVEPFVKNRSWLKPFGDILIMQTPDEMDEVWPRNKDKFTFLMQFRDWNRIDLTLMTLERYQAQPKDSQSILLQDKNDVFDKFEAPSDKIYFPTNS